MGKQKKAYSMRWSYRQQTVPQSNVNKLGDYHSIEDNTLAKGCSAVSILSSLASRHANNNRWKGRVVDQKDKLYHEKNNKKIKAERKKQKDYKLDESKNDEGENDKRRKDIDDGKGETEKRDEVKNKTDLCNEMRRDLQYITNEKQAANSINDINDNRYSDMTTRGPNDNKFTKEQNTSHHQKRNPKDIIQYLLLDTNQDRLERETDGHMEKTDEESKEVGNTGEYDKLTQQQKEENKKKPRAVRQIYPRGELDNKFVDMDSTDSSHMSCDTAAADDEEETLCKSGSVLGELGTREIVEQFEVEGSESVDCQEYEVCGPESVDSFQAASFERGKPIEADWDFDDVGDGVDDDDEMVLEEKRPLRVDVDHVQFCHHIKANFSTICSIFLHKTGQMEEKEKGDDEKTIRDGEKESKFAYDEHDGQGADNLDGHEMLVERDREERWTRGEYHQPTNENTDEANTADVISYSSHGFDFSGGKCVLVVALDEVESKKKKDDGMNDAQDKDSEITNGFNDDADVEDEVTEITNGLNEDSNVNDEVTETANDLNDDADVEDKATEATKDDSDFEDKETTDKADVRGPDPDRDMDDSLDEITELGEENWEKEPVKAADVGCDVIEECEENVASSDNYNELVAALYNDKHCDIGKSGKTAEVDIDKEVETDECHTNFEYMAKLNNGHRKLSLEEEINEENQTNENVETDKLDTDAGCISKLNTEDMDFSLGEGINEDNQDTSDACLTKEERVEIGNELIEEDRELEEVSDEEFDKIHCPKAYTLFPEDALERVEDGHIEDEHIEDELQNLKLGKAYTMFPEDAFEQTEDEHIEDEHVEDVLPILELKELEDSVRTPTNTVKKPENTMKKFEKIEKKNGKNNQLYTRNGKFEKSRTTNQQKGTRQSCRQNKHNHCFFSDLPHRKESDGKPKHSSLDPAYKRRKIEVATTGDKFSAREAFSPIYRIKEKKRKGVTKRRQPSRAIVKQSKHLSQPVKPYGEGNRINQFLFNKSAGRQCSDGGHNNNNTGSNSSNQNNCNNNDGSYSGSWHNNNNNQKNNNNSGNDNNNNNNNNNRRGPDELGPNDEGPENNRQKLKESEQDSRVPTNMHKHFRKKHSTMSDVEISNILGTVSENYKARGELSYDGVNEEISYCLEVCLQNMTDLDEEMLKCNLCCLINSLLKHFAKCNMDAEECSMCIQIFTLTAFHVQSCITLDHQLNTDADVCMVKLCKKFRCMLAGSSIRLEFKLMWCQLRKSLARIMGEVNDGVNDTRIDDVKVVDPSTVYLPKPVPPVKPVPSKPPLIRKKSRFNSHTLTSIREEEQAPPASVTSLASSVFTPSSSLGPSTGEGSTHPTSLELPSDTETTGNAGETTGNEGEKTRSVGGPARFVGETTRFAGETNGTEGEANRNLEETTGSTGEQAESSLDESIESGPGSDKGGFISLPGGPPGAKNTYYRSMKEKPTGIRGIDEVVYGNKAQLVKVVTVWEDCKNMFHTEAKLAPHYREEGVILKEHQDKFKINGIRYNNDYQWVKVSHLGNGMSGKCHLANDFETEFKFCVKELHISNYEKEEIVLWSELEHKYIVQIYGAIRHGEKIYIFQEIILGGCLTEAINTQLKLNRRLSQLTALRYFHQILEVLEYLKSKSILHEDLKADNILLHPHNGSVSIKVTDFGMAKRIQGSVRKKTPPVGTQTQWSPEKAMAVGYSFPAEVWAAVCVLVHMLSGYPPWIKRYSHYGALLLVIVEQSPPVQDIPDNISESIRELLLQGFTVSPLHRPTAAQLLLHDAFKLIDGDDDAHSINYSVLESVTATPNNQLQGNAGNEDLLQIIHSLENTEKQATSTATPQSITMPQLSIIQQSLRTAGTDKTDQPAVPSYPELNIDPANHIKNFYKDVFQPIITEGESNLLIYPVFISDEKAGSGDGGDVRGTREDSTHSGYSDEAMENALPRFGLLDMGDESSESDEVRKVSDEFELESALRDIREKYLDLPTVLNSMTEGASGSDLDLTNSIQTNQTTSRENQPERVSGGGLDPVNSIQTNPNTRRESVSQAVEMSQAVRIPPDNSHIPVRYDSIDDDDLYKSGSPPTYPNTTRPYIEERLEAIAESALSCPGSYGSDLNNERMPGGASLYTNQPGPTPAPSSMVGLSYVYTSPTGSQQSPGRSARPDYPWNYPNSQPSQGYPTISAYPSNQQSPGHPTRPDYLRNQPPQENHTRPAYPSSQQSLGYPNRPAYPSNQPSQGLHTRSAYPSSEQSLGYPNQPVYPSNQPSQGLHTRSAYPSSEQSLGYPNQPAYPSNQPSPGHPTRLAYPIQQQQPVAASQVRSEIGITVTQFEQPQHVSHTSHSHATPVTVSATNVSSYTPGQTVWGPNIATATSPQSMYTYGGGGGPLCGYSVRSSHSSLQPTNVLPQTRDPNFTQRAYYNTAHGYQHSTAHSSHTAVGQPGLEPLPYIPGNIDPRPVLPIQNYPQQPNQRYGGEAHLRGNSLTPPDQRLHNTGPRREVNPGSVIPDSDVEIVTVMDQYGTQYGIIPADSRPRLTTAHVLTPIYHDLTHATQGIVQLPTLPDNRLPRDSTVTMTMSRSQGEIGLGYSNHRFPSSSPGRSTAGAGMSASTTNLGQQDQHYNYQTSLPVSRSMPTVSYQQTGYNHYTRAPESDTGTQARPGILYSAWSHSPAINPKPPNNGSSKPDLSLNIKRAQEGLTYPGSCEAQTAPPVVSPPKSQSYARHQSYVDPVRADGSWPAGAKSSASSTSGKSAIEHEQNELLSKSLTNNAETFSETAKRDLSQSGELAHFNDDFDDLDDEHDERIDTGDPAESLAAYLSSSSAEKDDGCYVIFTDGKKEERMKIAGPVRKHPWKMIIESELGWLPSRFRIEHYILIEENGAPLDLDSGLRPGETRLFIREATEYDPWHGEQYGIIYQA